MAILESVRELASKLGAETNGRDITDQLNKINKHLDETALGGRDIAEAVKTYSENASGGGGGGETFEVEMTFTLDNNADFLKVISYTSTKTHSEVVNAINSGKKVIFTFILTLGDESLNMNVYGYHMSIDHDRPLISIAAFVSLESDTLIVHWLGDGTISESIEGVSGVVIIPPES